MIQFQRNTTFPYYTPAERKPHRMIITVTPPFHAMPNAQRSSRTPLGMSGHQIVKVHAQTLRIVMHIHALCLRHCDGSNTAHVAVTPGHMFSPHLQPCTRFTILERGAGVFAIVCTGDVAERRVAAGRVDFAGHDTHLWGRRLGWRLWVDCVGWVLKDIRRERSRCPYRRRCLVVRLLVG
jgi:hypothetical protein